MIIANYSHNGGTVRVEVLDVFENGDGNLAAVRALQGKPFADGAKTTTRTAYATVKACELRPQNDLLALALAAEKPSWYSGESLWIWGDKRKGAFLKNHGGFVRLCLVGIQADCPIFVFDTEAWAWRACRDVEANYTAWMKAVEVEQARKSRKLRR